jgi:hypothetical protein
VPRNDRAARWGGLRVPASARDSLRQRQLKKRTNEALRKLDRP